MTSKQPAAGATAVPEVTGFFHEPTFSISYLVADPVTKHAAIIDSVLDYDHKAGRTSTRFADTIIAAAEQRGLTVDWVLETHVHADHLSAGAYLRDRLGATLAIGENVTEVQRYWADLFNTGPGFTADGSQFDRLFTDGDEFAIGALQARVLYTPGHTPACVSYVIGDAAFVGDTIFMPDYGTARCDFPGGDARQLYRSIQRLLSLPDQTRLFMCHDYGPGGRPYAWETTVADQKARNKHVGGGVPEDAFVVQREARDRELEAPNLILPSLQVNIRGGRLPPPEDNGTIYLKIPLNRL